MSDRRLFARACALARREVRSLDVRNWSEWLGLFAENAVVWVPSFRGDGELVDDPLTQVSHIFYEQRSALSDRVERISSLHSPASLPLPRTVHHQSGFLLLESSQPDIVRIECSWTTHLYFPLKRSQHCLFGRQQYDIKTNDDSGAIAQKTTIILNEFIPTMADIYCF